jgi:hypothetical protein
MWSPHRPEPKPDNGYMDAPLVVVKEKEEEKCTMHVPNFFLSRKGTRDAPSPHRDPLENPRTKVRYKRQR